MNTTAGYKQDVMTNGMTQHGPSRSYAYGKYYGSISQLRDLNLCLLSQKLLVSLFTPHTNLL